jgi:hypothetical protein
MPNSVAWRGTFSTRQVQENFNPAVGFVDRTGIQDYALDAGYTWRYADQWLRSVYTGFDGYAVHRLDSGDVESEVLALRFTMQNRTQDSLFSRVIQNREVLLEPFTIYKASDGSQEVVIPPGDYRFQDYRLGIDSGDQRRFGLRVTASWGEFYDGDRVQPQIDLEWRPSPHFRLGTSYQVNDIDLPAGDFIVRLAAMQAQLVFSAKLSWMNLIQYDTITENIGINSRIHWIPQAGREGFIVLNHNLSDTDKNDSFQSTNADVSVKFSYTWRF